MPDKTLTEVFTDIADAIREKTGSEGKITPLNMAEEIGDIPTGPTEDGVYNISNGQVTQISSDPISDDRYYMYVDGSLEKLVHHYINMGVYCNSSMIDERLGGYGLYTYDSNYGHTVISEEELSDYSVGTEREFELDGMKFKVTRIE